MTIPPSAGPSSHLIAVSALALLAVVASPRQASAQLLLVQPATITFPSSDPDTVPVIAAAPIRVSYHRARSAGTTLDDYGARRGRLDLRRVDDSDLERLVAARRPSPPFRNGTLSTVAQTLATGTGFINIARGDVTFRFANSWNYTVGNYTQTITFTLSSP